MRLTPQKLKKLSAKLKGEQGMRSGLKNTTGYQRECLVCAGTGCVSAGAFKVGEALREEIKRQGLQRKVRVIFTGCNGFCAKGPVMTVYPDEIFYQELEPEHAAEIVREHFIKGKPIQRLLHQLPDGTVLPKLTDIPFFKGQMPIALRNRGLVDPESIDEYIGREGYLGAAKALTGIKPDKIIAEVKRSGLAGRGGAGFSTGMKWEFCAREKSDQKYMLCNADEGDPGAFMDRSILESDPHAVLEGMIIGARAIGATHGHIYVRAEYPLAVDRLEIAIKQAEDYGLLGKNILGTGFDFSIGLYMGAGAFVCGEETALMRSIEGRRGMPRPRPPFPAQKGLWDKPSVLNNVETLANIPIIIRKGAKWYSSIGTEKSKGTKVFAVTGAINNIGLVEVPMGVSLRTIIEDIGGGVKGGRKLKAVQLGGPSGGCVPLKLLDTPVDYESITKTGAIMGSGGMVVLDNRTCMVDIARYFLSFTADESCGKCVPCRIGTRLMYNILTDICEGRGREGDIERLEKLGHDIIDASLCGLGQTAPNPVLTTIKYFRKEYEEHIKHKRCSAVACKQIISSPCQYTCPINMDVPTYLTLASLGKYTEAMAVMRQTNALPGICGRVCTHPCEVNCRRAEVDEPLAIRDVKRFLADYEVQHQIKPRIPKAADKGKKVAVVGAGPAGLSCAFFLARQGYAVTIFEELHVGGGMMTVGIPTYRLPRDIMQYEIGVIESMGVEIKYNTRLGRDISIDEIFSQGYGALFLGIGAFKSLKLNIPGEDVAGVIDCIGFLRAVNFGEKVTVGPRVGVVGGGNAAIDAARVARRLGCDVTILYRRSRTEMPALKAEVDAADAEGIKLEILVAPVRVIAKDGKLSELECLRMKLGEPDASGRRRPVPIEGSEFNVPLDTLIPAISQEPDMSFLKKSDGLKLTRWNTFEADADSGETTRPGVFAGGDGVRGPATVTEALGDGKRAAEAIDNYLQGVKPFYQHRVVEPAMRLKSIKLTEKDAVLKRPHLPELPVEKRLGNFEEVELCLTLKQVREEGRRCLRCDTEGINEDELEDCPKAKKRDAAG